MRFLIRRPPLPGGKWSLRVGSKNCKRRSLRAENRQLKDRLFASKSEKKRPQDRSNDLDDSQQASERRRGHQPGSPGPRRRDHSHLPVVEEIVELSFDQRVCPTCGKLAGEMTETEDSELIEVEVRAHRGRIRRKRYRRTCDCPDTPKTLTAPAPAKLIPKGRYGISVWVHVLLAKFASHRALGNTIEALSHYDLDLSQGTITDGLRRLGPGLTEFDGLAGTALTVVARAIFADE